MKVVKEEHDYYRQKCKESRTTLKALFTEGDDYIKPPPIPMRYPMSRVVRVLFE